MRLHVASSTIIQAAAAYRTAQATYLVLGASGNLYAVRVTATSPPTLQLAWSKSQGGGRGSPFVTSTDGTNDVIVWGIGSEGDQRLHGYDGDTGASIYAGGGANELMTGTRRFNTGIAARGRIYLANDHKVYAFFVPDQPVTPIRATDISLSPDGSFQFAFNNVSGTNFSVLSATDLATPLPNWIKVGSAQEIAPGQYHFSDPTTGASTSRFYRVSAP